MTYEKEIHHFKSSNASTTISCYVYKPEGTPRAIVQISHGMCEYVERYEDFIHFLNDNQIIVCGNDHLGHKGSSGDKNSLGYFAPQRGWTYLYEDLARMTRIIKKQYPEIPLFLFGHSMGSFVSKAYLTKYASLIDGVILCGTSGRNPLIYLGRIMASLVRRIKGERFRSKFLNQLLFGTYNSHYSSNKTPYDWLTRDERIIEKYMADPYCNFVFTASAFCDLLALNDFTSSKKWYKQIPQQLPMLIVSGDMDPVGNWGSGIREVEGRLKKEGLTDLTCKLYPDFRHEILNETGREKPYQDILDWLNIRI